MFENALEEITKCAINAGKMMIHCSDIKIFSKSVNDFVTTCDISIQKYIIEYLGERYSNSFFVAEEKENMFIPDSEGFIIDPIDGTLNYINGIPHCAVCIAYVNHRSVQCSVVYNPFSNELFYASKGNGAYLNGERIYCLSNNFNRSIVLVDDCWDGDARVVTNYVAGFRCIGCAELAICYVACGRAAGYISQKIHVWDFSAGKIIIEESGGCLLNERNEEIDIQNTDKVLACSFRFRDVLFKINNEAKSNQAVKR